MRGTTFTCEDCGKYSDGGPGMDDAMDCFCDRCGRCGELRHRCICWTDEGYYWDEPA